MTWFEIEKGPLRILSRMDPAAAAQYSGNKKGALKSPFLLPD